MTVRNWMEWEARYGRKVLSSGLEGARSGREAFLNGRHLTPFLSESFRNALRPAALGACIGVLGTCPGNRHKSTSKVLAFGLLGSAIGFGAGIAWENRRFAASVARGAFRNIGRVRDEHWLEGHPIDYA